MFSVSWWTLLFLAAAMLFAGGLLGGSIVYIRITRDDSADPGPGGYYGDWRDEPVPGPRPPFTGYHPAPDPEPVSPAGYLRGYAVAVDTYAAPARPHAEERPPELPTPDDWQQPAEEAAQLRARLAELEAAEHDRPVLDVLGDSDTAIWRYLDAGYLKTPEWVH